MEPHLRSPCIYSDPCTQYLYNNVNLDTCRRIEAKEVWTVGELPQLSDNADNLLQINANDLTHHDPLCGQHGTKTLVYSARDGCVCCNVRLKALQGATSGLTIKIDWSTQQVQFLSSGEFFFYHPRGYTGIGEDGVRIGMRLVSGGFSPLAGAASSIISGDTSSKPAIEFANSLLKLCITKHNACTTIGRLPTRVLDINGSKVRLYEKGDDPFRPPLARYLALSHRWGGNIGLQTTTLNHAAFKEEIPWRLLPKTFQDAITFTRKLGYGIKYLWIDSLCIIQDSREDWQHESALMKEVYEGAFVTLAATASRDSSFGCFRQSELKATPFAMVKTVVEKKVQLSVIRTWGHPWTLFGDVVNAIEYPLLSRAWVFQERLLSARVLHFTNNELMWECKSMVACECSGAGKDADEGNGAWRGIKHPFPKSENAQPIAPVTPMEAMVAQLRLNDHKVRCEGPWALEFSSEWCITLSRWCELISHYSRLQLTRESDRLPAISGIAKSLPTAEYGQYLAGLWQFELPYSLCWRTMEPSKPRRNDSLPTWSWISINGPVEGFFIRGYSAVTCFVTVKEVKCDIIGQDPFGEVEKGKLELEGVLIKGICSDKKGLQNRGKELRALNYFHNRAVEFEGITHICCWDGEPSEIGEELWFLKVASNAKIDFYLVLQRLGKHGRTYRRVGLVEDLTITRQANQNAQGIASSASLLSGSTLAASSSNTSSMRSSSKSPSRLDVRRLLGHARRKSAESIDESGGVAKRITIV